jgi:serine/threonine-protein kinase
MKGFSKERWEQIDRLFAEALERPPDERTAFLRARCGNDVALYHEVVTLLESDAEAEAVLGESVTAFAAPLLPALEAELADGFAPGERVGPYRLQREIGRGGMGAVYLAERVDGQFDRRVALKVIKRGMDTDEILRRFRFERQILARLEHPHIARLYDAGVTDDGRPYLAMEYVDGQPLHRYCDARTLPVDERLRLFQTVCAAVQFAHQNLVIHRDLKPTNILVTEAPGSGPGQAPQVKLLDFGIAKLLSDEAAGAPLTRTGVRVLTPEYAAPEQRTDSVVTTAADVYALGVVLYELLTGRRPFGPEASPEAVPEPPSGAVTNAIERSRADGTTLTLTPETVSAARQTSTERLRRRLRGDLDVIVLKALRPEPERRYASAEAFLEDVKRHLAGLPVQARPDTLGYRLRKFVGRHTASVTAAVVVLALVLAFGALYTTRITQERNLAQQERDKAEEVAAFLESLFDASDPFLPERLDTLRIGDLLGHGLDKVQQELGAQPLVQAQMLNTIGRVYDQMGRPQDAEPLLRQALLLRQSHLSTGHADVASSLDQLSWVLHNTGQYEEAESLSRQALATRQEIYPEGHRHVAESMRVLAFILQAQSRLEEAEPLMRESLATYRHLYESGQEEVAPELATTLSTLGILLWDQSKHAEAESLLRESLALRRAVYGSEHPSVAIGLNNLAYLLRDVGRHAEAETTVREALAINRGALGDEHPHVASNLTLLGSVLRNQDKHDEAEPVFEASIALTRQLRGDEHPSLPVALSTYAALLKAQEKYDEAERVQREALAIARKIHGDEHFATAINTTKLADILHARGQLSVALQLHREGYERTARVLPADHLFTALARNEWASVLIDVERYAEAEPLLLESYRTLRESQGLESRYTESTVRYLITLYEAWGKPDEAASYRRQVGP